MTDSIKIFHNPRCSKSRATLELLHEKNKTPEVVTYLDVPPSRQELVDILGMLSLQPRQLMRTGEQRYKELNLATETDNEKLITAMLENPILIERPIVISDGKAAIGRPPESVLSIL